LIKMNKRAIYIIEHMEPELWEWCVIEYKHISKIIGKKNVWFTNVKKKDVSKLKKYGKVFEKKARDILENQERICILDPKAKRCEKDEIFLIWRNFRSLSQKK